LQPRGRPLRGLPDTGDKQQNDQGSKCFSEAIGKRMPRKKKENIQEANCILTFYYVRWWYCATLNGKSGFFRQGIHRNFAFLKRILVQCIGISGPPRAAHGPPTGRPRAAHGPPTGRPRAATGRHGPPRSPRAARLTCHMRQYHAYP
jgi:hypothetical protein